jgi:proline dehydrogenase
VIRQAVYSLSQQQRLRAFATGNPLARRMALRFVAGETLAQAIDAVRRINAANMTASLDPLGENVTSHAEARTATEDACVLLREITRTGVDCNASLKLTQLGLDIDKGFARDNLERVVALAAELGNFVRIDMESSAYVDRTLDIFSGLYERYRCVGTVIQANLYRSASDLEQLTKIEARVRLVKGAYLESVRIAFQRKADVDANFIRLAAILLARGNYPALATHDPVMIDTTKRWAAERSIGNSRFEYQMLYGIRRDIQRELVGEGYNVRVYVPFGTRWYPYLMRRMAERPANFMFVLSNIAREASRGQALKL